MISRWSESMTRIALVILLGVGAGVARADSAACDAYRSRFHFVRLLFVATAMADLRDPSTALVRVDANLYDPTGAAPHLDMSQFWVEVTTEDHEGQERFFTQLDFAPDGQMVRYSGPEAEIHAPEDTTGTLRARVRYAGSCGIFTGPWQEFPLHDWPLRSPESEDARTGWRRPRPLTWPATLEDLGLRPSQGQGGVPSSQQTLPFGL